MCLYINHLDYISPICIFGFYFGLLLEQVYIPKYQVYYDWSVHTHLNQQHVFSQFYLKVWAWIM